MPYREVYLVMVSENNNNKYYHMVQQQPSDDTFMVKYGRVQGHETLDEYSIHQWDKKYNEKIKKGYQDITQYRAAGESNSDFQGITDSQVADLIAKLQSFSSNTVKKNYTIAVGAVTKLQLDGAQEALNDALNAYNRVKNSYVGATPIQVPDYHYKDINGPLLKLYTILPRQMSRVQDYLINGDNNHFSAADKLLANEQDVLDSLATQVNIHHVDDKQEQTLLDALGIRVELVTDVQTINTIKGLMGESAKLFHRVYLVENHRTEQKYRQFVPPSDPLLNIGERMLFHSSRNNNWLSILEKGLLIRPSGAIYTGSMLGDAIYFADKAAKSIGYSSLSGSHWAGGNSNIAYLALYDVYVGKSLVIRNNQDKFQYYPKMNYQGMQELGYNSVHADSRSGWLRNDEFTIYHPDQCTISYLIELRN